MQQEVSQPIQLTSSDPIESKTVNTFVEEQKIIAQKKLMLIEQKAAEICIKCCSYVDLTVKFQRSYRCKTCERNTVFQNYAKLNTFSVCEWCKSNCHPDHEWEEQQIVPTYCECRFFNTSFQSCLTRPSVSQDQRDSHVLVTGRKDFREQFFKDPDFPKTVTKPEEVKWQRLTELRSKDRPLVFASNGLQVDVSYLSCA
jgi:hypothetical protein